MYVKTRINIFCILLWNYIFTYAYDPDVLNLLQFHSNYMISSSKVLSRGKRYSLDLEQSDGKLRLSNIINSCVVNMIWFQIFLVLRNYIIIMCTHPRIFFWSSIGIFVAKFFFFIGFASYMYVNNIIVNSLTCKRSLWTLFQVKILCAWHTHFGQIACVCDNFTGKNIYICMEIRFQI